MHEHTSSVYAHRHKFWNFKCRPAQPLSADGVMHMRHRGMCEPAQAHRRVSSHLSHEGYFLIEMQFWVAKKWLYRNGREYVCADKESRYPSRCVTQLTAGASLFVLLYLVGIDGNSGKEG